MNERISGYVDELFAGAPKKRRVTEIQEELLSNLNEKFEDLLSQDKSEDEAFSIAVEGIGDIRALIADVAEADRHEFAANATNVGKGSLYLAIGISLYIAGLALLIAISVLTGMDNLGVVVMMFVAVAATGFTVYGAGLKKGGYKKEDDTFVEEYKEKITKSDKASRLYGAITSTMWIVITMIYLGISFLTFRWDITWVIFLVGAVLQQLIYAAMMNKVNIGGIIWTSTVVIYLIISFISWQWHITWLIFLAAAACQQIIRLVRIWREE